jgi:hypothetical protein
MRLDMPGWGTAAPQIAGAGIAGRDVAYEIIFL